MYFWLIGWLEFGHPVTGDRGRLLPDNLVRPKPKPPFDIIQYTIYFKKVKSNSDTNCTIFTAGGTPHYPANGMTGTEPFEDENSNNQAPNTKSRFILHTGFG